MRLLRFILLSFSLAGVAPTYAQSAPVTPLPVCAASELIAEGDMIKLFVFERLSSRDEDWTKSRDAAQGASSFALRTELSGEMRVGADGVLFLPLLGGIKAAGVMPEVVSRAIAAQFKEIFGHDPRVNLTISQRKPVYVVGYVKNPGRYEFSQGMTLTHALAIAGGVVRVAPSSRRIDDGDLKYMIAREDREGMIEQAGAEALTPLCPGDLVRIVQPEQ